MTDEVIRAASEEPSAEDVRLRGLVTDLISRQNQSMVDLAKNMLTITFTAIGVVLAFQQHWPGHANATGTEKALVIASLIALFLSVPVYCAVIKGYRIKVSTSDYQDVEPELTRLASVRSRLVNTGMVLTSAAAILLAIAIV
jgi:uncharacterized membrane protein